MVLTPNPASGEQVGAGLAEGIVLEKRLFLKDGLTPSRGREEEAAGGRFRF